MKTHPGYARRYGSSRELEERWPPLPYAEWRETCETLHLRTQIVGNVKLELVPFLNDLWEVSVLP